MTGDKTPLRSMVTSAAMGALALVLPVVFHAVGLGSRFLPMLLPLVINSYLSQWGWAAVTAALVPWISAFATGMPPLYPPMAAVMSLEGIVISTTAALTRRFPLVISLPLTIAADRATAFLASWILARAFGLPAAFASGAMLLHSLPGVALQLAVVPIVLRSLRGRKGLLFG